MAQQHLRLRPDIVPLQWHEAVAVVQVVARQLMASDAEGPIPSVAGLTVDHNGSVHVLDGPHMPSTNRDGSKGLAALLQELLRGSPATPASLASLADGKEGASERFTSIVDFSQALVFFERPLSQPDLAAHAAKLATAQEQRRLNEELDQLTQKAREVEPAPQQKERGSTARRRSPGRKAAIAVLVVTFLILAIFVAALTGWNRIGSESVREVGSRLVERVRAEAKTVLTSEAPSRIAPGISRASGPAAPAPSSAGLAAESSGHTGAADRRSARCGPRRDWIAGPGHHPGRDTGGPRRMGFRRIGDGVGLQPGE